MSENGKPHGLGRELTEADMAVLRWIAAGCSRAFIARALAMTPEAIDTAVQRILVNLAGTPCAESRSG